MPFATVMFSEWGSDGFLYIQHDPDGSGGAPKSQVIHPLGFVSRPHDPPEDGNGCTVDVRRLGSERFAWLGDDPRSVDWLPRCTKGGSATYGGALGRALTWREIDGTTGSIVDYIPVSWDATGAATAAHKLEAGVDGNGAPVVQAIASDGACWSLFDGGATIADATGSGYVDVRGGSVTISGALKATSGLDVGGTGGQAVPLHPALASAVAAFAAAVAAAPVGSVDGGAVLKAGLTAAAQALSAAVAGCGSTMLRTL
jgi:hypothetical protein